MSFSGSRARLVDAVFTRLGEDALWNGAGETVLVRLAERDEVDDLDRARLIVTARILRVRASEVAAPAKGDSVVMLGESGTADGRNYTLLAEPRRTRNAVWLCEVTD